MEEGRPPIPTLVIDSYIGMFTGETLGARLATSALQETNWKLTRFGDKPVILTEKQREPSLVFRSQQDWLTVSAGTTTLTGTYKLNGDQMIIGGVAAQRRACLQDMKLRERFSKPSNKSALGR